jgi:choline dehydrogenase-like flavoprotein
MENAVGKVLQDNKITIGADLLKALEDYNRGMEVRITGDDLPMPRNRVRLDEKYVDEHGLPVAQITRDFGPAEERMFELTQPLLKSIWAPYAAEPINASVDSKGGNFKLIGDHQMGSCRMGEDPNTSVLDPHCRVHGIPNLYVVDSSFMPTGLGLNPMVAVMANALRVGSWIIDQAGKDANAE